MKLTFAALVLFGFINENEVSAFGVGSRLTFSSRGDAFVRSSTDRRAAPGLTMDLDSLESKLLSDTPTRKGKPAKAEKPKRAPRAEKPEKISSSSKTSYNIEVPKGILETAPKKEAPKKEAPKKEAPKKEAPKKEAPPPKKESTKAAVPKKEAPKRVKKAAPVVVPAPVIPK